MTTTTSPTIHEAERASDATGAVFWGDEIGFAGAVARRLAGQDVVVRGSDLGTNRALAQSVEAAAGAYMRGPPHKRTAGPLALPHFQQATPPPEGHTFYETDRRKARKRP